MRQLLFRATALSFALVVFEGSLGILDLPRDDTCWAANREYWIPDPALGFAYKPGAKVASGTVNALGLRGPVPPRERSPGRGRILYVGDSSVYGFGVADDETFWSLVTRELATRNREQVVEPLVAAAPAYSSYQSRVLVERMLAWQPDWVVFYVGAHNDHKERGYYADAEIPARMARRDARWHRVRTLRVFEYVADRAGKWLERRFASERSILRVPPAAFERNLRAMIAATREAGSRPLLLIPPVTDTLLARHREIPAYQEILKRLARELDLPSVDLAPIFAAENPKLVYRVGDDFHPSALGHRLIASAVAHAIAPDSHDASN